MSRTTMRYEREYSEDLWRRPGDRRMRLARLRRELTIEITCERASISRMTLFRAEAGSPAIALGTLLRILSVLGLEGDLEALARDDKAGRVLQDQALPLRRRVAHGRISSLPDPRSARRDTRTLAPLIGSALSGRVKINNVARCT
jgi:transcriptional regulator with XRE-family HTH domain